MTLVAMLAGCEEAPEDAQASEQTPSESARSPSQSNEAGAAKTQSRAQAAYKLDTRPQEPAQIMDAGGFDQPVVAATLQLPKGWKSYGGVVWNDRTNCAANQMQWGWTALAPDSITAIEKISGFSWQVTGTENQFNPCPSAPIRTAKAFLESTATRLRPNAQVLEYVDLPDVARQMAQKSQGQVRWEAGRLTIAYKTQDGIPMHELLTAAVSFTSLQGSLMGGAGIVDTQRAPAGRLDPQLNKRIGDTIRLNPQWQQAAQQRMQASMNAHHQRQRNSINDWHSRQMAAINARGEADRAALRMRTNREVADIYAGIAANTSATNDRMHGRAVDATREVNTYRGVDGQPVQSSIHGGNRVFQDTNNPNNVYSTNDPYHNPSGAVELQRSR